MYVIWLNKVGHAPVCVGGVCVSVTERCMGVGEGSWRSLSPLFKKTIALLADATCINRIIIM